MPTVKLKIKAVRGQAWFLWNEVEDPKEKIRNGSVVEIEDRMGQWVGRGFYNGHARVRLRCLTENKTEAIDGAFFERRIEQAFQWRVRLGIAKQTNAFRVVHSEGDWLSGLVVDLYKDLFVIEYFSSGMFAFRQAVEGALKKQRPGARFYRFAEKRVQKQESFDLFEEPNPPPVVVEENGLKFHVQPGVGYKTGFFVDQRDNRLLLSQFCANARVLDLCCHSGAFSVYAKSLGKAASVRAVDLNPEVLAMGEKNAVLNGCEIEWIAANLYEYLPQLTLQNQTYDVVVLDPAKQTRSEEKRSQAMRSYVLMNQLALKAVAPGGIFVTCSCSGWVSEEVFLEGLREAARLAERKVQIFHLSGASADHPFLVSAPQSRYLKTVWARVA